MPDEYNLTLRQADQIRTDVQGLETELQVIMAQLARLPPRWEVARLVLLGSALAAALVLCAELLFR
jgi:hypothetical protein